MEKEEDEKIVKMKIIDYLLTRGLVNNRGMKGKRPGLHIGEIKKRRLRDEQKKGARK